MPTPPEAITRLNIRLLKAAEEQSAEAVAELVRQGAELDYHDTEHGYTALHAAASAGNLPALYTLLDLGAEATALDAQGSTPLMYAAYSDKPQAISALLHRVPDYPIEHCNQSGYSALSLTLSPHYKMDSTIRLLDAGAQPHAHGVDKDGSVCSPYDVATQQMNGDALYLLNQYAEPPALADASRASVFAKESLILQHPRGWAQLEHIAEKLSEEGQPLGKSDLLGDYAEGRSYLARAAECNQLPRAMAALHAQGDILTPQNLLDDAGKPNALLATCIERQCVGTLMTEANWKSQSREAMEQVWRALPQEGRDQVRNYFSLRTQLNATSQAAVQGR